MVPVLARMADADQPSRTPPGICLNAVAVVDHDRNAARAAARTAVAPYFDVIAEFDQTLDVDPELLARIRGHCNVNEYAEAGWFIPDDLLGLFAFCGTPREVAEHAAAILDSGARRVEFDTPFGLTPASGIDLLCNDVIGRIRAEL
jgi:5,10-methylenetetrahydromethanopterin reductase